MSMIYKEGDADLTALAGRVIGVVGYAALGRAIAQNLRDSEIEVIVSGGGEPTDQSAAHQDGFAVGGADHITREADILILTLPEETLTTVYMNEISPHIRKGQTLILTSAYSVAFGFIEPPPFIDVGMIAPRTIGDTLRARYQQHQGTPAFVAVWQDASREMWRTLLAVAAAMGALRAGAVETTMTQEAELSLFVQQAILPAFHHIMTKAARVLLDAGYGFDAVFIDLYLSGKFNDYMYQVSRHGLLNALTLTNLTGQYGTYSRLERFDELKLERLLEVTLNDIRDGQFAREWAGEYTDGHPRLNKLLRQHQALALWDLEQQTIDLLHEPDDDNV